MIPYTYLISFLKTGQRYYGVRFSKTCHPDELGKTYFSSSKLVNSLIKEHGLESFIFKVRRIFSDTETAKKWESKVLSKIDAAHSDKWLNKHNNNGPFYARGKHSEESKRKMSESHKKMTQETKTKFSIAMKKLHAEGKAINIGNLGINQKDKIISKETRNKISKALKGRPLSEDHKRKVSEGGRGKKLSQEHKDKISKSSKGRVFSIEHRKNLSIANQKRSQEKLNVKKD